jgi:hypothetical protein
VIVWYGPVWLYWWYSHWSESVFSTEARLATGSTVQVYRDWCTIYPHSSITGPSKGSGPQFMMKTQYKCTEAGLQNKCTAVQLIQAYCVCSKSRLKYFSPKLGISITIAHGGLQVEQIVNTAPQQLRVFLDLCVVKCKSFLFRFHFSKLKLVRVKFPLCFTGVMARLSGASISDRR